MKVTIYLLPINRSLKFVSSDLFNALQEINNVNINFFFLFKRSPHWIVLYFQYNIIIKQSWHRKYLPKTRCNVLERRPGLVSHNILNEPGILKFQSTECPKQDRVSEVSASTSLLKSHIRLQRFSKKTTRNVPEVNLNVFTG